MVIEQGDIWWANLPEPEGSEPGYRRPVVIVQSNEFNRSQIRTVVCVAVTSNLKLAEAPGNVQLNSAATGLPRDSVANVSQVITLLLRRKAMSTVTIELNLPEDVYLALQSAGLSREELSAHAAKDLALQLYIEGRLSLGNAARLAGLRLLNFWALLAERRLPVFNYTDYSKNSCNSC